MQTDSTQEVMRNKKRGGFFPIERSDELEYDNIMFFHP